MLVPLSRKLHLVASLAFAALASNLLAHNLDTSSTAIQYADDFIEIMKGRAALGQQLIQPGDEFWASMKTTPGPGTVAPATPDGLAAGVRGRQVTVLWEHGAGPAPVDYVVTASGLGSVPTGGARRISGELPPGTYDITVRAVNACGSSAATPPHRVTVAP